MAAIYKTFMEEAKKLDPAGFARAQAERDEISKLSKDAERWRKSRRLLATKMFDYYLLEGAPESEIDAWVDAIPVADDAQPQLDNTLGF